MQLHDSSGIEEDALSQREAALSPIKSYLPWADLQGLNPHQSAFQRTHPAVRKQVLDWLHGMGHQQAFNTLLPIHHAQSRVDALRAVQGRPSPYKHPSQPQPYLNPMDTTMRMQAIASKPIDSKPIYDAEMAGPSGKVDKLMGVMTHVDPDPHLSDLYNDAKWEKDYQSLVGGRHGIPGGYQAEVDDNGRVSYHRGGQWTNQQGNRIPVAHVIRPVLAANPEKMNHSDPDQEVQYFAVSSIPGDEGELHRTLRDAAARPMSLANRWNHPGRGYSPRPQRMAAEGRSGWDWDEAPPGRGHSQDSPWTMSDPEQKTASTESEEVKEWEPLGQMHDANGKLYNVRWGRGEMGSMFGQALDPDIDHTGEDRDNDHEAVIKWNPYDGEIAWRGAKSSRSGGYLSMFLKDHLMKSLPHHVMSPQHSTNLTSAGAASLRGYYDRYGDPHGDIEPALRENDYGHESGFDDEDDDDYSSDMSHTDRERIRDHGFTEDDDGGWSKDFNEPVAPHNTIEQHYISPDGRLTVRTRGLDGRMIENSDAGDRDGDVSGALNTSRHGFAERNLPAFGWTPHYKEPALNSWSTGTGTSYPPYEDTDRAIRHVYPYKWTKKTEVEGDSPYHSTITTPALGIHGPGTQAFQIHTTREGRDDNLLDSDGDVSGNLLHQEAKWTSGKHAGGRRDFRLTHPEFHQAVQEHFGRPAQVARGISPNANPQESTPEDNAGRFGVVDGGWVTAKDPDSHDPSQSVTPVIGYNWDTGQYEGHTQFGIHAMPGRQMTLPLHTAAAPELAVKQYEGTEGNNNHITRNELGMVPLDWVKNMPGLRGERPGEHRNAEGSEWDEFKDHVAAGTPGYSDPIFIMVEHGGQPAIAEGNHRRDAYAELGHTHLPAEIRYFGHAEREGTVGERAGMPRTAATGRTTVYHLTDNPRFKLDETFAPEDNSLSINPRDGRRGLYVGQPERWAGPPYNYKRPYVAELSVPTGTKETGRWGGENFIPADSFGDVRVERVMPYDHYIRREYKEPGETEEHTDKTYDTGELLRHTPARWQARYPEGFDVEKQIDTRDPRQWSDQQHADYLAKRRDYLHDVHHWGWNEFDDQHGWRTPEDSDFDGDGEFVRRDRSGQVMNMERRAAVVPGDPQHGLGRGHTAPASGPTMDDPEDAGLQHVYDHPEYYVSPRDRRDPLVHASGMENWRAVKAARGNPDAQVQIYRAVPHGITEIEGHTNPAGASWVSASPSYAKRHAEAESCPSCGGDMQVISGLARAGDLHNEGYLEEWGYTGDPIHDASALTECPEGAYEARKAAEAEFMKRQGGTDEDIPEPHEGYHDLDSLGWRVEYRPRLKQYRAELQDGLVLHRTYMGPHGMWETYSDGPGGREMTYAETPQLADHKARETGRRLGVPPEHGEPSKYYNPEMTVEHPATPFSAREDMFQRLNAVAIPDESGLKAAGIAVIAMDTGRVLMQQRALNPLMCPCGQGVTWDESNGYQHDDGSVSHDNDEFYGQSVSDLLDQGHSELEKEAAVGWGLEHVEPVFESSPEMWRRHNHIPGDYVNRATPDPSSAHPNGDGSWTLRVADDSGEHGFSTQNFDSAQALSDSVRRKFGFDESGFDKTAALEFDPNEGTWEFPGGKIDPGESPRDAAVREFREEVGQDLPPGVFVGAWVSPGGITVTAAAGWVDPEYQKEFHEYLDHEIGYSPEDFAAMSPEDQQHLADGFGHYIGEEHPRDARYHLDVGGAGKQKVRTGTPGRTVRVLRVEKPNGEGPFAYGGSTIPRPFEGNEDDPDLYSLLNPYSEDDPDRGQVKQRQPYADGIPARYIRGRSFGFLPQHRVDTYFTPRMLQGLHERGFGMSEYDVPGESLVLGRTQVAWRPEDATRVSHTPLLEHVNKTANAIDDHWQQGGCGTYACALMKLDPSLKFGTAGDTELGNGDASEGWIPRHHFAHDDTHYYDSRGRHPLGDLDYDYDHVELNGNPGDWEEEHWPAGLEEAKQHALAHGVLTRHKVSPELGEKSSKPGSMVDFFASPFEVRQDLMQRHNAADSSWQNPDGWSRWEQYHPVWGDRERAWDEWPDESARIPSRQDVKTDVTQPMLGLKNNVVEDPWEGSDAMEKGWAPRDAEHPLHHEAKNTDGPFYHGTVYPHVPGDQIDPNNSRNYFSDEFGGPEPWGTPVQRVFFTRDQDAAARYGEEPGGLFRVEPTGPYSEHPWEKGTLVSAHPLKVVERIEPKLGKTAKSPVYKGFIYLIQRESDIDLGNRAIANPDDPDGDMSEQSAWWDIEHAKKNPALRAEAKKGTPWAELELWADKSVRTNREVTAMVTKLAIKPTRATWPALREMISTGKPGYAIRKPSEIDPAHHDMVVNSANPNYYEQDITPDRDAPKIYALKSGRTGETTFLAPLVHKQTGQTGWVRGSTDQDPRQWRMYHDHELGNAVIGRPAKYQPPPPRVPRVPGVPKSRGDRYTRADAVATRPRATGRPMSPEVADHVLADPEDPWREGDVLLDDQGHQLVEPRRDFIAEPRGMHPWDFDWDNPGEHPALKQDYDPEDHPRTPSEEWWKVSE